MRGATMSRESSFSSYVYWSDCNAKISQQMLLSRAVHQRVNPTRGRAVELSGCGPGQFKGREGAAEGYVGVNRRGGSLPEQLKRWGRE